MNKHSYLRPTLFFLSLLPLAGLVGCTENESGSDDMQKRQDAALKDPFSYDPSSTAGNPANHPNTGPAPDPSLQPRDDDLKSEWKRFWNP